jgi:hypothetical protein
MNKYEICAEIKHVYSFTRARVCVNVILNISRDGHEKNGIALHCILLFRRCLIRISVGPPDVLIEALCVFPPLFLGMCLHNTSIRRLLAVFFRTLLISPSILPFDAVHLLIAS